MRSGEGSLRAGLFRWFISGEPRAVGFRFLLTAFAMGTLGGLLSMLVRAQLTWPEAGIAAPESYLSIVTLHGTTMVFLAISPAVIGGLGHLLLPGEAGVRGTYFLGAWSYWAYVLACLLALVSFLVPGGAAASGWTAAPLLGRFPSAVPGSGPGQTLWLVAMIGYLLSVIAAAGGFVLAARSSGRSGRSAPSRKGEGEPRSRPFSPLRSGYLVASVLLIVSQPVLAGAYALLLVDRHAGTSFFSPSAVLVAERVTETAGGSPLLFRHLVGIGVQCHAHALLVAILGAVLEILGRHRTPAPEGRGRVLTGAFAALALIAPLTWSRHLYTTGPGPFASVAYGVLSTLGVLPMAVIVHASLLPLRTFDASPVAVRFALAALAAGAVAGGGTLLLSNPRAAPRLEGTFFEAGHLHFFYGGLVLLGLFAAFYEWFPAWSGGELDAGLGKLHLWATIVSLFAVFSAIEVQGIAGLVRYAYDPAEAGRDGPRWIDVAVTAAAVAGVAAQALLLVNVIWSALRGPRKEG